MEKINNSVTEYIEQLTWLRGIAAFFVIISHSFRATEVKYSDFDEPSRFFLLSIFDIGSFGVILFFVLSGCTLYISNSKQIRERYIFDFYIKRFFRIWPAFFVSMIFYVLFSFVFSNLYIQPQGHWIEKQFLSTYSISDVFSYLTLTFNITGPKGLFNNAYWSLPVEFQYYIIFPVIAASIKYTGLWGPVLIGLALYLAPKTGFFDWDKDTVFLLAYSFCGGVLIGHLYQSLSIRINSKLSVSLLLMLILLVSCIRHSYILLPDVPIISGKSNWYIFIAIAMVSIVLFSKFNLHNKVKLFLKHYGTISYSTYLYHNLFIAIAVLAIVRFDIFDSTSKLFFTFLFTLISSYFAAIMSYRLIEKPAIKIARNIINRDRKFNKAIKSNVNN